MSDRDRVRWRCRRGMLELDLLLAAFLARHFERLDAQQRAQFETLLERSDNELFDLVTGRMEPEDRCCEPLLHLLRGW